MAERRGPELLVGVFATLALVTLGIAVMAVGGDSRLFRRGVGYRTVFADTTGLRIGSPAKMAGVQVGTVTDIFLPTDPKAAGIEVEINVGRQYAQRVRQDSITRIGYLQLLSGEKYVEITPGSPSLPELAGGSVIEAAPETEILEQGADIAQNMSEITLALRNILQPLERGEGLLGKMLQDPSFGVDGLERLGGTLENLEALTGRLRRGEGFVGRLLYDPEFASRLDDLSGALGDLAEAMKVVSRKEGAFGALVEEGGAGQQAIENLRDASASLRNIARRLESAEGLLGRLLNDPEYSEALALDARRAVHGLAEIVEKINRGEGTLGALVNERTLHDGLEEVAAGVNDSKFARWLLRHYQKKGIKRSTETRGHGQDD